MNTETFVEYAKKLIREYIENSIYSLVVFDEGFDIYVVWQCKTLQNYKALLVTSLHDGMYYEVTYNGDKEDFYLDVYEKVENKRTNIKAFR